MRTHKIRHGETISSIAKLYAVDKGKLAELNGLSNINKIHEGQTLKIPDPSVHNSPPANLPSEQISKRKETPNNGSITHIAEETLLKGKKATAAWLEGLLQKLRIAEANEHVQKEEKVDLSKDQKPPLHTPVPPQKTGSKSPRKLNDVKEHLKEKLGKEPHVVSFNGVKLTENEKKQITASVAVCEMSSDGFGSVNSDQEFVGRKYGAKGIGGLSYSRIVHIGLSYGVIQYTQDSGSLGLVLQKMKEKNSAKFTEIFGGGDAEIADNLITLTTTGRADLADKNEIPLSGQAYWNSIKKKDKGKELSKLANGPLKSDLPVSKEIRGKRVQPIPAKKGESETDLWTGVWHARFLQAGNEIDFQEAQLEFAVLNFFNPILSLAKTNKVRSALALGFIAACNIRGGVGSKLGYLFYTVAKELKIPLPFGSSEDERKCLDRIAAANGKVGNVDVDADESRRAKLLIKDELGFLAEDLYDTSTY